MKSSNNEILCLNDGVKLYEQAKKLIPGGTQLLSKRPEMFLPGGWPSYYSKAKGCFIWDLKGHKYIDMTTNGIGSCLLGFADDDVNNSVINSIRNGSMSTLNAPEEVLLAQKLCNIHPWAQNVRFARTGGEIMSMAVRIARAGTGRDKIAFCGYHGWHDWYLAANLSSNEALNGHLLPGLPPTGVPGNLAGSALPFHYNQIDELDKIVKSNSGEIAAIVMEPLRYNMPKSDFLKKVRDIASKSDIVLIFDEITSGWRFNLGGVHLSLGTNPDIAVFAKSISNGFPMAAVIGKKEVMDACQSSFISSTYWTEAIGPVAALATISKMEKHKISEHVKKIGFLVQGAWKRVAEKYNLPIIVVGMPCLTHFSFKSKCADQLRTLLTQEMLKKSFLAATSFYPTLAHTESIVEQYINALDEVFAILKIALEKNKLDDYLCGPVAHTGFSRLT